MLTVYTWENNSLKESAEITDSCWINISGPSTGELERVQKACGMPQDFLTDPLDKDERPRFDWEDSETYLIIIHVPYLVEDEGDVAPYGTVPLGIILCGRRVVTICSRATPVTTAFLDQIRRVCPPCERYRFAFRLLWQAAVLYLRYLNDIQQRTNAIETELHKSISNDALLKLLAVEKSFVYFTTSLKADTLVLGRIEKARFLSMSEDDRDTLEDAEVEFQQAQETASVRSNILNGTLDTFASLINNNLNNVMKYLTVFTILLAAPTFIASLYGMNVRLPFSESPWAFAAIVGVSALITAAIVGVLAVLSKKRIF